MIFALIFIKTQKNKFVSAFGINLLEDNGQFTGHLKIKKKPRKVKIDIRNLLFLSILFSSFYSH